MKAFTYRIVIGIIACASGASAQNDPNQLKGTTPFAGYQIDAIDTVSMLNGNVMLHIPLYSIAQLGSMPMSFSISGNNLAWTLNQTCGGDNCVLWYAVPTEDSCPTGIGLQFDQDLALCQTISQWAIYGSDQSETDIGYASRYQILEGGTEVHPTLQDNASSTTFRAADGSLLTLEGADSTARLSLLGPYDIYDRSGTNVHFAEVNLPSYYPYNSGSIVSNQSIALESTRTDRNNNSILRQLTSDSKGWNFQDTLNRTFRDAPRETQFGMGIWQASSLNTGPRACPVSAKSFQDTVYKYDWQVPGTEGQTLTYSFCYARVYERTDFFEAGPGVTSGSGAAGTLTASYVDVDGAPDTKLQSVVLPDGSSWQFEYDSADPTSENSEAYGDLTKVITPQGGSISYSYTTKPLCMPVPTLVTAQQRLLTSRIVDDGLGHVSRWDYSIGVPFSNSSGASVGATTTVTNPLRPGETSRDDTEYEYHNLIGSCPVVETEERVYQGSGADKQLLSKVTTEYNAVNDPNQNYPISGATGITVSQKTATQGTVSSVVSYQSYDGGFSATATKCLLHQYYGATWQCITEPAVQVSFALPKDVVTYDFDGSLLKEEQTAYVWEDPTKQAYYQANLLSLPSSHNVLGSPGRVTTFHYDDSTKGSPSGAHGNLTSTSVTTGLGSVGTSTVFNATGTPKTTYDGNANETDISYDSTGAFVSGVTSGGLSTKYSYDQVLGTISSITDPNNVVTEHHRADPLGRLTLTKTAAGLRSEADTTYQYPDARTVSVTQDKDATADGLVKTTHVLDGLGRIVARSGLAGSVLTQYDPFGNVQAVSNLFAPGDTPAFTSYRYDAARRLTYKCNADNIQTDAIVCSPNNSYTSQRYADSSRFLTDELGNTKTLTYNALGQLTAVVEPGALSTTYNYDSLGNLSGVQQKGLVSETQRIRAFDYDSMSRLITARNPESGVTCYGVWSGGAVGAGSCINGYDGNGNLLNKTDPRPGASAGTTTTYSYDRLNRLRGKTYTDSTPTACYKYGTSTIGYLNGRPTDSWTQVASTCPDVLPPGVLTARSILAYDPAGRVVNEQQCVSAGCTSGAYRPISFTYDLLGDLEGSTDGTGGPNVRYINWEYDSARRTTNLWVGSSNNPTPLFAVQAFRPNGWSTASYGSAIKLSRSFDSRDRVSGMTALVP